MSKSTAATPKTFVVDYEIHPMRAILTMDVTASNPVTALNIFHRFMQDEHDVKPSGYTVRRLAHRYPLFDTLENVLRGRVADMAESNYDLPKTPNPDIKWERRKQKDEREAPEPTSTMDFYNDVVSPPKS